MRASANSPKYEKLALSLERQIRSGQIPPGAPLPSQRELMAESGVSLATVRRCLDILAEHGLLTRQPGKGVFVADVLPALPADDARDTGSGRLQASGEDLKWLSLGVFCHDWRPGRADIWCERVLRGAEDVVRRGQGRLRLVPVAKPAPRDATELLARELADGLNAAVFFGDLWPGPALAQAAAWLRERRVPAVSLYSSQSEPTAINAITIDGCRGMAQAVAHLTGLGHRDLIFCGLDGGYGWSLERANAFRAATTGGGLRSALVLHKLPPPAEREAELLRLLTAGYTAIVAVNDDCASWVVEALRRRGRRVPEDISVIGFDDDFQYRHLELTTLGFPLEDLGAAAVDLLARVLYEQAFEQVRHLRVPPRLLVRRTTAPPPAS